MSDAPSSLPPSPTSGAPTARIVNSGIPPSGDYRITESGETRDFEDGEIEQLD